MRSKDDAARNKSRTFDPKKLVRTGSITTYVHAPQIHDMRMCMYACVYT